MELSCLVFSFFFFFNDTATTEIYTLSLHDALPISVRRRQGERLPTARGLAERSVLQLGLGRSQLDGELAEDLGVGMKRVARRAPLLIGKCGGPLGGHVSGECDR